MLTATTKLAMYFVKDCLTIKRLLISAVSLLTLTVTGRVDGADVAVATQAKAAPSEKYNWTGFYVGGYFGYGWGSFGPGTIPLSARPQCFRRRR